MTPCSALLLDAWTPQQHHAVREALEAVLNAMDVPPNAEGEVPLLSLLELTAEELLTNIFRHAYSGGSGQARVECLAGTEKGRKGVLLRFTDWGPPFNPFTQAPTPDVELACEARPVGGLGVFLTKSVTERYSYERRGLSNIVEFFFPLRCQADVTPESRAGLFPRLVLMLAVASASILLPHSAKAQSVILQHDVVVEEVPAQALRPRQPVSPVHSGLSIPEPARIPITLAPMEIPTEYLLEGMDVQALSPHAALLALPRMVPPPLALALREGLVTAPPQWEILIAEAAVRHGLPEPLIAAVIKTESDFRPDALSHKGAQGLMQLMPATQRHLGVADPFDPRANVLAGCDYLRRQWDRFGSLDLALAAYNAGPENVVKYGGIPPFEETQNFVRRVRARMGAP